MQEVMDEHRPVLAPGSPDAEAEHRLIQEQPREHFEAPGQAQTRNTVAGRSTALDQLFPAPRRLAAAAPVPTAWAAVPFSDSPSASICDLGFDNQHQSGLNTVADLLTAGEDMPQLWVMDDSYANRDITFEEFMGGAGSASNMQP
jgi:hypothetical protein